MDTAPVGYHELGLIIGAMAAIGTAAFGLVDSTKAFWGGFANVGFGHLERCLSRFSEPLDAALGADDWRAVFRAHWRNGVAKADQKAMVRSLIRLGLTAGAVEQLAQIGRVKAGELAAVVEQLEAGRDLTPQQLNVLGRIDASIDALVDAAFERADQQYRNVARVAAGIIALGLSMLGGQLVLGPGAENYALSFAVGLLAVPVAPVAKDLTSALSTSMQAIKTLQGLKSGV